MKLCPRCKTPLESNGADKDYKSFICLNLDGSHYELMISTDEKYSLEALYLKDYTIFQVFSINEILFRVGFHPYKTYDEFPKSIIKSNQVNYLDFSLSEKQLIKKIKTIVNFS